MTSWFGHTQTVASISKSVSTVAGGIICLESNVTSFMKKVIYYEGFFQRMHDKLPDELNYAAKKLIRRCYEYREAIRDELQSSVAYVADAGRWLIGMEDWNTKMEKRLGQITELVILANSLLMEYMLTGEIGAKGAEDDLSLYVHGITNSIVLQDDALFKDSLNKSKPNSTTASPRDQPPPSKVFAETAPPTLAPPPVPLSRDDVDDSVDDDDRFNPFNAAHEAYFAAPMPIPKRVQPVETSTPSPAGSATSHSYSDYCHLDEEYAATLSEMRSFPPTMHRGTLSAAKKQPAPARKPPVYDLTMSFDFQKERAHNPFVRDPGVATIDEIDDTHGTTALVEQFRDAKKE
ncbi:hypothetical protein SPRG_00404 [Saprolegnia parasitica CBS 223.65]|uniref:Uncharacterized protein n=1 Tax=Saprolegnia parasitica (strain CBS 223.65) TaxID=695850 RepID=A0A067CXX6_SAPPC|nr:hypothetical protein SPRG_00404 [Saprolegnia parasitica CBS 223.65]KDO35559.1 hypothetical protein SPRG_00404 [Saprolegnia parasitica CBS 223.65]|eukprot:XP_012193893.1 hypothetical protein SPRG_00404 [Saprolegnia parasitica CBS 223.65]